MKLAFSGGVHQFFRAGFEIMKTLIDESRTLYAAIQARCPDGPAERFVISYTSERALRDLLAAPSIIASGCTTRARAEELCRGETPTPNSRRRVYAFMVSVPYSLARTLRVVFDRDGKLLVFLGRTWRMVWEKSSLQVGRANA
jgi:hypothetical protein